MKHLFRVIALTGVLCSAFWAYNQRISAVGTFDTIGGRVDVRLSDNLVAYDKIGGGTGIYSDVYTQPLATGTTTCLTCGLGSTARTGLGGATQYVGNPSWSNTAGNWLVVQVGPNSTGIGTANNLWVTDAAMAVTFVQETAGAQGVLHPHFDHAVSGNHLLWSQAINITVGDFGTWALHVATFNDGTAALTNNTALTPNGTGFYETNGFSADDTQIYYTYCPQTGSTGSTIANRRLQQFRAPITYPAGVPTLGTAVLLSNCPTCWDEFMQMDPTGTHLFYDSTAGNRAISLVLPNQTDYWTCDPPNCTNRTRMTYYNTPGSAEWVGSSSASGATDFGFAANGKSGVGYFQGPANPGGKIVSFTFAWPSFAVQ